MIQRLSNRMGRNFAALVLALYAVPAVAVSLRDDSGLSAEVAVDDNGRLAYAVQVNDHFLIENSPLGIIVDGVDLGDGVALGEPESFEVNATYRVLGAKSETVDHARGLRIPVVHQASGVRWTLECRIDDEGFAYRYAVPGTGPRTVNGEATAFTLPAGARCWFFERANDWKLKTYAGVWRSACLDEMPTVSPNGPIQGPPLVVELPQDRGYLLLTEAALFNYSGMRLEAVGQRTFQANFTEADGFTLAGAIHTPWRVVLFSKGLQGLVSSDLVTDLAPAPDPKLFSDTSYIRPGRCVWRWWSEDTGTPEEERAYVDHAERLGFEYTLVDEGWKDWTDPWRQLADLGRYAAAKHVGVFLWSHWKDLNDPANDYAQLRAFLDKVAGAGLAGVKIDFMNGEDLTVVRFNEAVLREAARRRLLVNFHGCGKPTGEARTYPNEITREAIRGLELNRMDRPLPPEHDAALPFTRFAVGHADYTPLTVDPQRLGQTTIAHQAATFFAFTSPMQVLAENPSRLLDDPNLKVVVDLLRDAPTVWDETRVLPGSRIGQLAVLARRSGSDWYVAGVNGSEARIYDLSCNFLEGGPWQALGVHDGDSPTSIKTLRQTVQREAQITLPVAAGGGFVVRLRPDGPRNQSFAINATDVAYEIDAGAYTMNVVRNGFRFSFERANGGPAISAHKSCGLEICAAPVAKILNATQAGGAIVFQVETANAKTAIVRVTPDPDAVSIEVTAPENGDITFQLAGLAPVYGLGDNGGQHTAANLDGFAADLFIDGGPEKCRFFSPFAIFPAQRFAGVSFWPGLTKVAFKDDAYRMTACGAKQSKAVYFLGDMPAIYAAYRRERIAEGYPGVAPKFRFFQLGWESWDALRWDTNQKTVHGILQRYVDHEYPIRWAVTGSGFWPEGGTTTNFGFWNKDKYPDVAGLRDWLHQHDVAWLIGIRTNFVVEDGPFTPEGLEHGYFLRDDKDELFQAKSTAFPKVPCYMLDGEVPGAAEWYADLYKRYDVDGVKEDTMIRLPRADIFNAPIRAVAESGALVMARNGAFSAPGTLIRMEDMVKIDTITARMPITWLQFAASAAPNVYCDAVGFGGMKDNPVGAIRHAWMCALTAGMSVGAEPWHWSPEHQACLEKAIRFHETLAPYLFSAAADSHTSGYPHTLTPLPIAFPDDQSTYNLATHQSQQYEWMVGPNLLATPLLRTDYRTNDRMDIYLPAGTWMDFETGKRYEGPKALQAQRMPLDRPPCFVGGSGILVLRSETSEALDAVIYPVHTNPGAFRFTYPDGASVSTISKKNVGWDPDSLLVKDESASDAVPFSIDEQTGAVRFRIQPGHNYSVSAGQKQPDGVKAES